MAPAWHGRTLVGLALMAAPAALMAAAHSLLGPWALYSETEVFGANVLHPLFNSAEHFSKDHWRPDMTQRDRLEGLTAVYRATVQALSKLGVTAFLESSSLIGLLRHGGHMPWEVDGDVGVLEAECIASNATKAALAQAIDADFVVLKFACSCEEDCEGDNRRMAGRVAHKASGVVIDIFMYAPVKDVRPFQQALASEGTEWWERVHDHADYTFPKDVLLPLKNGTFEGVQIMLPNEPREFLSWEYGRCLGAHVWPWRLLLYTPVSVLVPGAIIAKGAVVLGVAAPPGSKRGSPWVGVASGAYAAVALGAFQGGITLLLLLACWACELAAVVVCPELLCAACRTAPAHARAVRRRHRLASLAAMAAALLELRGCIEQVACQVDDFYFRPMRPKSWTLCLFGRCWDL